MRKKFKKALSIAVAASLALSMPVSVMAEETTENTEVSNSEENEFHHDPNAIIKTDGKEIEKTGDITVNNDNAVQATNGSKVTVNGNVTANGQYSAIYNDASEVTVSGNVTSDNQVPEEMTKFASETVDGGKTIINGNVKSGSAGVYNSNGSVINVNGSVNAKEVGVLIEEANSDGGKDSYTSITKGVTVTDGWEQDNEDTGETLIEASGVNIWKGDAKVKTNVYVNGGIKANAKDDSQEKDLVANGVRIINNSGEIVAVINGDIKAGTDLTRKHTTTRGIWINEEYGDETQKTNITVDGNISSSSTYYASGVHLAGSQGETIIKINGNIDADAYSSAHTGKGVGIALRGAEEKSVSDIIVNGDVTGSTYGLHIGDFDGKANVVVNGTLSGDNAIFVSKLTETYKNTKGEIVTETYGDKRDSDITVWKMTSNKQSLVVAEESKIDYTIANNEEIYTEDKKAAEEVLKNINYIIRTDKVDNGTIKLSNTRLISGFDTARETEEITIKVQASDGYQVDSVKNGDAVLTRNADGTYTLTVPRGGGVQLSAVLSAIQKSQSSSSGSSGSSSSSRPGVTSTNVQTIPSASGATVATTTSDSNGTHNTNAVVKIADKQATVSTSEQTGNGNSIIIRNVNGDVAGATFTGVGTVSADGKSIATADGQVHAVTQAPMLVIKTGDQSVGCFVDLTTGAPLATGKTEVYYQLGADGQMYAHWVNPMGFFYTGTVVMNGHTITFNEQGVMIDVR